MGFTFRKDTRALQALIQTTPAQADRLLRATAEAMVSDIKLSFGTSPSAPGDPPGVDTGALRASMRWQEGDRPQTLWIVDGVAYGLYLELGTERMAARPFISPVFEAWRQGQFQQLARQFGVIR